MSKGNIMRLFTRRFFANFKLIMNEFVDKPTSFLEIGVFQGYTAEWILQNILKHPESRYIGIDPWERFKVFKKRFDTEEKWKLEMLDRIDNLRERFKDKAEFIKGFSQEILYQDRIRKMKFDIIYVDGNHTAQAVMNDYVLSWPLLKIGGIMIFDDYLYRANPYEMKNTIDIILSSLDKKLDVTFKTRHYIRKNSKIELIWKNFSVAIRKLCE